MHTGSDGDLALLLLVVCKHNIVPFRFRVALDNDIVNGTLVASGQFEEVLQGIDVAHDDLA